MKRLAYSLAAASALVLAACNDGGTDPAEAADDDDYSLVMFGAMGSALENTMGLQGGRPFDGRTGAPGLPAALRLTDEQRAEIAALREAFRAENQASLDALKAIFEEARAAREDGATREEVRDILDDGRPIGEALRAAVQELHDAIAGVLTDEQRAWLDDHRRNPPRDLDGRRQQRTPPGRRGNS